MNEGLFQICQLCGNPYKDKDASCVFCTGDLRRSLGVEWGWMYQAEFDAFSKTAEFFAVSTWFYGKNRKLSQYRKKEALQPENAISSNVNSWISIWGAHLSGKTWLINAFFHELEMLPNNDLFFCVQEKLNLEGLIRNDYSKKCLNDFSRRFPIASTMSHTEQRYFLSRQKHVTEERRGNKYHRLLPGSNSHIHEILLYDSPGGWHTNQIQDIEPDSRENANLARERISGSQHIIILLNPKQDIDAIDNGLSDLIGRIKAFARFSKIAICLNSVENTDVFWRFSSDIGQLKGRDIFDVCLEQAMNRRIKARNILRERLDKLTEFAPFADIEYFCLSSCGYLGTTRELNLNVNKPAKMETDWEPINVSPVFAWFLDGIEQPRIDCRDEVFADFEKLPKTLEGLLEKLRIPYKNTYSRRLSEYIHHRTLLEEKAK